MDTNTHTPQELLIELLSAWKQTSPLNVWVRYNVESDTLFVLDANARGRAGVSVPIAGSLYLRVAPDRSEAFGIQVEDFIAVVAPANPEMLDLLDQAETPGMTNDDIMGYRRRLSRATPSMVEHLLAGVAD